MCSSKLASSCKATRYNYINQRTSSFQHGGRHSAHAETFPGAAISGRCWITPAGRASVDLHRSGQCQGQPWAEPGPEEIALTAQGKTNRGARAGGRDIRPAQVLFSPVRAGPSGWFNF